MAGSATGMGMPLLGLVLCLLVGIRIREIVGGVRMVMLVEDVVGELGVGEELGVEVEVDAEEVEVDAVAVDVSDLYGRSDSFSYFMLGFGGSGGYQVHILYYQIFYIVNVVWCRFAVVLMISTALRSKNHTYQKELM